MWGEEVRRQWGVGSGEWGEAAEGAEGMGAMGGMEVIIRPRAGEWAGMVRGRGELGAEVMIGSLFSHSAGGRSLVNESRPKWDPDSPGIHAARLGWAGPG